MYVDIMLHTLNDKANNTRSLPSLLQRGKFRVKPYEPKLGKSKVNNRVRSFTHQ